MKDRLAILTMLLVLWGTGSVHAKVVDEWVPLTQPDGA